MHAESEVQLKVGIDDRMSAGEYVVYGLQHLLALTGIWILPGLLGLALNLDRPIVGYLIQACYLTAGLVTILQASFLLKLPIVQGPTAAFFAAILQVGKGMGLATAYGALTVAALIWMVLSIPLRRLSVIGYLAPLFTAPLVYGMLILIIGAQLTKIGLAFWLGVPELPGFGWTNFLLGLVSVVVALACMILGRGFVQRGAVLWGVIVGSLVYALVLPVDLAGVAAAGWVGVPQIYPFGFDFSAIALLIMLVAFIPATTEALAFYQLLGRWGNQSMPRERMSGGIFGDTLGCAIGSVFGGMATTSYPENIAIIRISGVGSRFVALTAGILAVALGLMPKVGMILASLPIPVLAATATLLFGIIAVSGVQILSRVEWDHINLGIAGLTFSVALGVMFLPEPFVQTLGPAGQALLTEPMVVAAIMLIVLNATGDNLIRPALARRKVEVPAVA